MLTKRAIKILGENLYKSNYSNVILRESIQNALDSGTNRIEVTNLEGVLEVLDFGVGITNERAIRDIGESQKLTDTSGGNFGLAKLALFLNEKSTIESNGKKFCQDHLLDDSLQAYDSLITIGTLYRGFGFDLWDSSVISFLSKIITNIEIFYNGMKIECQYTKIESYNDFDLYESNLSNFVGIALNGVYSFGFQQNFLTKSLLINFKFTGNIFDNEYPLNASRDDLKQNYWNIVFTIPQIIKAKDDETTARAQEIARNSHLSSVNTEFGKMVIDRKNVQLFSTGYISDLSKNERLQIVKTTTRLMSTYKRYIEQINNAVVKYNETIGRDIFTCVNEKSMRFGYVNRLSDGSFCAAAQMTDGYFNYFYVNPDNAKMSKGEILGLALHEYTHLTCGGHDEDYAGKLTDLVGLISTMIFNDNFRK